MFGLTRRQVMGSGAAGVAIALTLPQVIPETLRDIVALARPRDPSVVNQRIPELVARYPADMCDVHVINRFGAEKAIVLFRDIHPTEMNRVNKVIMEGHDQLARLIPLALDITGRQVFRDGTTASFCENLRKHVYALSHAGTTLRKDVLAAEAYFLNQQPDAYHNLARRGSIEILETEDPRLFDACLAELERIEKLGIKQMTLELQKIVSDRDEFIINKALASQTDFVVVGLGAGHDFRDDILRLMLHGEKAFSLVVVTPRAFVDIVPKLSAPPHESSSSKRA